MDGKSIFLGGMFILVVLFLPRGVVSVPGLIRTGLHKLAQRRGGAPDGPVSPPIAAKSEPDPAKV